MKLKIFNLIINIFRRKKSVARSENELSLILFVDKKGELAQEVFTKKGSSYIVSHKKINKIKDPFESWRSFEFK